MITMPYQIKNSNDETGIIQKSKTNITESKVQ